MQLGVALVKTKDVKHVKLFKGNLFANESGTTFDQRLSNRRSLLERRFCFRRRFENDQDL